MNKGIAVFLILVGGMNIASADDNVSQQIQLLNSQIQAQIQKSQSDQQVQIKELNKQIQAQLKQMQTDLQAQIQKSVSTTQDQLKQVQTALQAQIKTVQQQGQPGAQPQPQGSAKP